MKNFILFLFIELLFCQYLFADVFSKAKVLKIGSPEREKNVIIENVSLEIISGKHKNKIVDVKNYLWDEKNYNTYVKPGDTIVIRIGETIDGKIDSVSIKGYQRDKILFLFLLVFLIVVFVVCGKKGLIVVASITTTISLYMFLLLPMLKNGYPPIIACGFVAMLIALVMLLLILGFSKKFIASILGLSIGMLFSVLLSVIFVNLTKISGLFMDGSRMLLTATRSITGWTLSNFRGIIIGSVIIASLGVTLDIVVDIVVGMSALHHAKKDITKKELIASGLKIGGDVLSGMLGRLLLVFTAGSIIMLTVYTVLKIPVLRVINWEFFAVVILEVLIGSITFVIIIPATVFVSSLIFINK
ncbi:MAG: YibE/F family protein [Elusimicrobia bacterium]|nr:YibE/F family protein [Elusimicrobiota bacterium]